MVQQPDQAQIQQMVHMFLPFLFVGVLFGWALIVIPFWQIFKKSGMGGPLALLMIIPLVNIIMVYVLAFSRWKVVPAPEYAMGYPPAYPPQGYTPAPNQPSAYPPAQPAPAIYTPPPQDPPAAL